MRVPLPDAIPFAVPPDLLQPVEEAAHIEVAAGVFKVQRCYLTEGSSQGVELIIVDNGTVSAAICPTRGMGLWKAAIGGQVYGWQSPVAGPVHPQAVPIQESSGLGWLEGFDELLVRCGLQSFGAPDFDASGKLLFPLHGRIANQPARKLSIEVDKEHSLLQISGEVQETRFLQFNLRLEAGYRFAFGEPRIDVCDRITNDSSQPAKVQMLYHVNVGAPLLQAGGKMHLGTSRVVARNPHAAKDLHDWNSYLGPTPGYQEQVYFSESAPNSGGWCTAVLASRDRTRGFALHYRADSLPFFTQWKNTVAEADGYVTGLEPGTGFPNPRSFEEKHGRIIELEGGNSIDFHLQLEGITQPKRVDELIRQLNEQRSATDVELVEFDPDWCVPWN